MRNLITSPATQHGFTIGDRVAFKEYCGAILVLHGVGVVVGFCDRDRNCVAVEKVGIVAEHGHPPMSWRGFYSGQSTRELRPFAVKELTLLERAPSTKADAVPPAAKAYRVLSADGAVASSRTWDNYEDALRDATKRAERDENFREFQVVAVVTKAKAEKIAVTKYTRGPVVVDRVA